MIDLYTLLSGTSAYRTVISDKTANRLSHAYLFLSPDKDKLCDYLKFFAKLIVCKDGSPCGKCRACRLIEQNAFADLMIFPSNGQAVVVDDITTLISESYVKPIENSEKVFVISNAETMNLPSQNKLLKTLEEPPRGVHILMGATSEYPLLPTVKSRVKKIEIPAFTAQKIFDALKDDCPDLERLKNAIACGDGTVGKTLSLYADDNLNDALSTVVDTLVNMKSSANLLDYANKILALKIDLSEILSILELLFRDMLVISQDKGELANSDKAKYIMQNSINFSTGAILHSLDKINEAYEKKKFNANPTMLVEWLLFQILEGKYKWQKL